MITARFGRDNSRENVLLKGQDTTKAHFENMEAVDVAVIQM